MFDAYYHEPAPGMVIFDTNRGWTTKLPALVELFPDAKVVCCVRNPAWVLDSVESLIRRNVYELSGIFSYDSGGTVYSRVEGLGVYDVRKLAQVVWQKGIDVAVIAVPARVAQRALNQVMSAGVKAVLNFAPVRLHARLGVKVKTVDLTISLESLSYFLARPQITCITNPRSLLPYEEIAQREEQELQQG